MTDLKTFHGLPPAPFYALRYKRYGGGVLEAIRVTRVTTQTFTYEHRNFGGTVTPTREILQGYRRSGGSYFLATTDTAEKAAAMVVAVAEAWNAATVAVDEADAALTKAKEARHAAVAAALKGGDQ